MTRRPFPGLALALTAATALFLATVPLHRHWFDVGVYYGAVGHWSHGGRLYDYLVPGTRYGFTYPPFAAVSMLPMTLLTWPGAVAISVALNAAAAALLLHWLAGPVIRRHSHWPPWFAHTVAGCLLALLEPVRDTFSFGQVNLLLLALVLADARLLATGHHRYAGLGTGLATAIKLTPAIFIVYLLLTGRRRAAATAASMAAAATGLTAVLAPGASRTYWTAALWDTDRIGSLAYISNQSLQGVLARLDPASPSRAAWLLCVLAVLGVWAYRVRRLRPAGDELAGLALTGCAACLVSPVTWVHHLVWLIPSLVQLADAGLRNRRPLLPACVYVLLCSSVVWLWHSGPAGPAAFLGGNAYTWLALALLLTHADPVPDADGGRTDRPRRSAGRAT